jgi:hypothetical protein
MQESVADQAPYSVYQRVLLYGIENRVLVLHYTISYQDVSVSIAMIVKFACY